MKSVAALSVNNFLFWVIQVLSTILEDTLRAVSIFFIGWGEWSN